MARADPRKLKRAPLRIRTAPLAKERLKLETGDAAMIHTGWGKLYCVKDKDKYLKSSPGIGIESREWLIEENPMLAGTDSCCAEVRP